MSVDNDLLLRDGKNDPADGEIIYVAGRIRDQTGKPIKGARVEIWQANAYGRYSHPRHENTNLKLDPNFLGFGHFLTGKDGAYRFRSIKPAPYPDSAAWVRPPHIHFAVFPPNGSEWTTQMYFAGEPLNENDFLRSALGSDEARKRVTVAFRPAASAYQTKMPISDISTSCSGCRVSPTESPEQRRHAVAVIFHSIVRRSVCCESPRDR